MHTILWPESRIHVKTTSLWLPSPDPKSFPLRVEANIFSVSYPRLISSRYQESDE